MSLFSEFVENFFRYLNQLAYSEKYEEISREIGKITFVFCLSKSLILYPISCG